MKSFIINKDYLLENNLIKKSSRISLLESINPENYKKEKNMVDGLKIDKDIPNISSIESTLDNYIILEGIRLVPIKDFEVSKPRDLFYAKNDVDKCIRLSEEIKYNREIKPLIVVSDSKGIYILEGAHRLGALSLLGVEYIPALVVIDEDN